jgi:hypothetical protein
VVLCSPALHKREPHRSHDQVSSSAHCTLRHRGCFQIGLRTSNVVLLPFSKLYSTKTSTRPFYARPRLCPENLLTRHSWARGPLLKGHSLFLMRAVPSSRIISGSKIYINKPPSVTSKCSICDTWARGLYPTHYICWLWAFVLSHRLLIAVHKTTSSAYLALPTSLHTTAHCI